MILAQSVAWARRVSNRGVFRLAVNRQRRRQKRKKKKKETNSAYLEQAAGTHTDTHTGRSAVIRPLDVFNAVAG